MTKCFFNHLILPLINKANHQNPNVTHKTRAPTTKDQSPTTKDQYPKTKDQRPNKISLFNQLTIMRDFRKLEVWHLGVDFAVVIYEVTADFPKKEQFGLISQLTRAAVSVSSNLAEGCSRRSAAEFARFIEIAIGSSFEMETQLTISTKVKYISPEKLVELLVPLHLIQRRMQALRNSILPQ